MSTTVTFQALPMLIVTQGFLLACFVVEAKYARVCSISGLDFVCEEFNPTPVQNGKTTPPFPPSASSRLGLLQLQKFGFFFLES